MRKKESLAKRIVALVLGLIAGLESIKFAGYLPTSGFEEPVRFALFVAFGIIIFAIALLMAAVSAEVEW